MKLIVGLGNPGKQYERTYHNAGFQVVDALVDQLKKSDRADEIGACRDTLYMGTEFWIIAEKGTRERIVIIKPLTFMNESGRAVKECVRYAGNGFDPAHDLWVVHDDGDIALGSLRVSSDKRAAGHRGVSSIIEHLCSKAFMRFRIGIRGEGEARRAETFVLAKPRAHDRKTYEAAIARAAEGVMCALAEGIEKAQERLNKKT